MKNFLFLLIFFVFFLLISYMVPSYGAGDFSKHYNMGIEFYKQGKYDQAGKAFEEAIKIKPNDVYALYGLGNTYYCKAKYDEAVKIYLRAININPDYAKVHYSLSLAYSKLGMTGEAEKEKAIFRKLSQGGESERPKAIVKPSRTDEQSKEPLTQKKPVEAQTKPEKEVATRTPIKEVKPKEEPSREFQRTPTTRRSTEMDDSRSIFKGYTDETRKKDKYVFSKKYYKETYGASKGFYGGIKIFVQKRWYESGINKILICSAGYILVTQIWLCVVTFFTLIIWRVREKV